MRYLVILKYLFISDIRRIYNELLVKLKNKNKVVAFGVIAYIGLCSLVVTIMSLELVNWKIYNLFHLYVLLSFLYESLNINLINYFADIKCLSRMLIYPISLKWMCFLNIIKFVVSRIITSLILFSIILISSAISGMSLD